MFGYYLDLALRSLKRNKALTVLMVLAIAAGIGASMTTLTVQYALSGDPLPGRSAHVYRPQIDPQDLNGFVKGEDPPAQMTWIDGMNLLHAGRAERQALMTAGVVSLYPERAGLEPFRAMARYTSHGFFPMFGVPFKYGHAWNAKADAAQARVLVLSERLNQRLFGGADSTGKTLDIGGHTFRVVGVLEHWRPAPHFYDLTSDAYDDTEGVFMPLTTARGLHFTHVGNTSCWGSTMSADYWRKDATCTWLQFWVQLGDAAAVADYRQFLVHYSAQQKALGRFARPPNVRLPGLMQWLRLNHVLPDAVRVQTWLAFGFLLVCLVNTIGLLLAKFLRRAGALGVRRALGASRRAIFAQLLVESGLVGLLGGFLGLLLSLAGLWLVRQQPADYAALAHLDGAMLAVTFALAVAAGLLAGLLPAWRACHIVPALQLKEE